jgi:uncharacterized phage protein (TIGR02220 family)
MERGWVKLWRKLLDSEIFQNEGVLKVAVWALLRANHREVWVPVKTGRGKTVVHLQPGEFIFGRRTAARELKMPPSTFRNRCHFLRKARFMDHQPDHHYSIGTVINWPSYQPDERNEDQPKDHQRTTKGHRQELKEVILSRFATSYLNQKTGSRYSHKTKATRKRIGARYKEGHRAKHFKRVIDTKCSQWLNDPKMRKYLRPETLFGTKFEGYLNEEPEAESKYL